MKLKPVDLSKFEVKTGPDKDERIVQIEGLIRKGKDFTIAPEGLEIANPVSFNAKIHRCAKYAGRKVAVRRDKDGNVIVRIK